MAETATPSSEPSLLNEPLNPTPAPTPEATLFPEVKKEEPTITPEATLFPEVKKEEPKAAAQTPSPEANKAPVDYDNLKLPDGSLLSAEELAVVKKEAKEQKLSLEEVNGVFAVKNDAVKSFVQRQNAVFAETRAGWRESWKTDPEFGGLKLNESTELAKRAWDKLADSELKTLANQAGFGDHPAVLRMMARVGRMFAEDTLQRGVVGGQPGPRDAAEVLYGKTSPGEPRAA